MDRPTDLVNCVQIHGPDMPILCNHGGGFLDHYDWGYTCGNCGSSWRFKTDDELRTAFGAARRRKDFVESDRIRAVLMGRGIDIAAEIHKELGPVR
jgi:hypothetical protein